MTRRLQLRARVNWLARAFGCAGVAVVLLVACSAEEAPSPDSSEPRWARRFLPFEARWRPESEIPAEPQKTPQMVIWELSRFAADTPPTSAQKQASAKLVEECQRAALEHGWFDFETGLADGYTLMFQDRRHYENREYMLDDRVLDPDRPEFLMYYGTPQGKQLTGFMFYVANHLDGGPQIGGNDTIWHYHVWNRPLCALRGLVSVGLPGVGGQCKQGIPIQRSPEMLHVWLVDHPDGFFTTSMMLPTRLMTRLLAKRAVERPYTVPNP
jgi:hypothetical protein